MSQSDLVQERFTRTAGQFASFSHSVRTAEATQLLEMARAQIGVDEIRSKLLEYGYALDSEDGDEAR